jgi:DNA-binding transcriptional MerR regulator
MYYLQDLAKKLGVNARTLRLYAQKKHFPSEVSGQRLAFTEDVYLGLLAHIGMGKPLSTFRQKVQSNQRGNIVNPDKEISELTNYNPDNVEEDDPDNEYVLELEEKNSQLLKEIFELKAELRQLNLDIRGMYDNIKEGKSLSAEFVEANFIYKFKYEKDMSMANRKIERLEKRIEHMARNPQPTDILTAVAPPIIQLAEKWLTHKNKTLADQVETLKKQPAYNSYRGGFEPRVNPDAKLKGNLPKEDYYDPLTGL